MSMGDNGNSAIRLVRADGLLIIGISTGPGILSSPRAVQTSPAPNGMIEIHFIKLFGNPKTLTVGTFAFSFACEDENMINAYRENISGLTIAKKIPENVIELGGRH